MNLKTRFLFITIILLVIIPAKGFCFDITAHVDKSKISKDDSILLTLEVNGGKADLDLSMIKDFKVISRGSSSSYNYINGKSQRKASYQYVLIPLSKGKLNIPPIKAVRKGQTAFTKQIIIQISDQAVNPEDVRALFAVANITNTRLFVGEQAVYSLKFFTSKRLSGLGFEKPPEFNGLSSKAFEKEKTYTQTINGLLYQVTQVNYIIIPTSPGTFNIDPAILIANVMVKSKRDPRFDSFFNDSFFSSNSFKLVKVASNPVKVEVLQLPPYQGKNKFTGLVGRFDIEGSMDKTSLKAGESITFTIKISGSGNIMDAGLPGINLDMDGFKVYDDNPVETIHLTENGYEGFKIFKKAIVPVNPGKYLIKPVTLTYFDVEKKAYQMVSTKQIRLDVVPSEEMHIATQSLNQSVNGSSDKSIVKKEVSLVNKDILEIKEGLAVLEDYKEIDPLFFIVLLSIPGILFSGVKLFTVVTKKDLPIEKIMEEKAKYHLKQAKKANGEDKVSHLYSSLVAFILAKGKQKGEAVTLKEAQTILRDESLDEAQIGQITRLLETIESVRFGGKKIDDDKARQLFSKTSQILKLICLAVLFMGVFSFVPQKLMADPTTTLVNGIKNYKTGNFKKAAQQFEDIAKTPVRNPHLFYNIANAYLKADDIGQAILWYERAKLLSPNDPDLIFNLAYANTLVKDKKENTMNIIDILFLWDRLIPPKTIQLTAIFFSFVFFTWAALRVVKKQKVLSGAGLILCSIFVLLTAVTFVNYYNRSAQFFAVIVQDKVAVRSGVTETATELFSLHEGTKVSVKEQRDGYIKIEFSKGKVGWVKTKDAAII